MASSSPTAGNDPLKGVDPGGTRPTKPGNPDKGDSAKPANVSKEPVVKSGSQNDLTHREDR